MEKYKKGDTIIYLRRNDRMGEVVEAVIIDVLPKSYRVKDTGTGFIWLKKFDEVKKK